MAKLNDKKFGKNLQKQMDALGMKPTELAEKSGLTRAAISTIISGKREPQLSTVVKILNVIPTNFETLVT